MHRGDYISTQPSSDGVVVSPRLPILRLLTMASAASGCGGALSLLLAVTALVINTRGAAAKFEELRGEVVEESPEEKQRPILKDLHMHEVMDGYAKEALDQWSKSADQIIQKTCAIVRVPRDCS